jgi:hypothetical protein
LDQDSKEHGDARVAEPEMLALELGGGRFTVFQAAGIFLMGQRRSRARGGRFNFGFGNNGILHHVLFWRVEEANAKGRGRKTLPLINADETDLKKKQSALSNQQSAKTKKKTQARVPAPQKQGKPKRSNPQQGDSAAEADFFSSFVAGINACSTP